MIASKVSGALHTYHNRNPRRPGVPVQEVRSRLDLPQAIFIKALAQLTAEGIVVESGRSLRLPDHQVELTPEMEKQVETYLAALREDPYSPSSEKTLDPELLTVLVDSGKVVRVNESGVFTAEAYKEMADKIIAHLKSEGSITVADARTMFNSSRKYLLPLLEYLDQQQITRRVGDERVLR